MPNYMWRREVLPGKNSLLFVEGLDDARFFASFLSYLKKEFVQVAAVGGKGEFRKALKSVELARNADKLRSIGVIRDSNDRPQDALKSLESAVEAAGLPKPIKVRTPPDPEQISVYVALVPGPETPGCLETMLFGVVSAPERECIDTYLECMSALCEVHEIDKARLFAYLAVGSIPDIPKTGNGMPRRSRTGLRLGEAAEKGIWPWESPILGRVKALLEAL